MTVTVIGGGVGRGSDGADPVGAETGPVGPAATNCVAASCPCVTERAWTEGCVAAVPVSPPTTELRRGGFCFVDSRARVATLLGAVIDGHPDAVEGTGQGGLL